MSLVVDLPVAELTLDDVATLAAADPDHRYELQEGTLLVMPPPPIASMRRSWQI